MEIKNEIATEIASKYNKGLIAATDTHSGRIGKVYTLARGETFAEFFRNIRKGNSFIMAEDLTREDLVEKIDAWIDLIFSSALVQYSSCSTGINYLDKVIHALPARLCEIFRELGARS